MNFKMAEEYRSVEQRIFKNPKIRNAVRKAGKGLYEFCTGAYGGIAGLLRIPTSVRKITERSTRGDRLIREYGNNSFQAISHGTGLIMGMLGIGAGSIAGSFTDSGLLDIIQKGILSAGAITNLASLFYEIGRDCGKRAERRKAAERGEIPF